MRERVQTLTEDRESYAVRRQRSAHGGLFLVGRHPVERATTRWETVAARAGLMVFGVVILLLAVA